MKINDNLKKIAYKISNQVIEKFRNKKLNDEYEMQRVQIKTSHKICNLA